MPGFLFLRVNGHLKLTQPSREPGRFSPRQPPRGAAGWLHGSASPKLQRAAGAFLLRLVAENGVEGAARVLCELADEIEGLPDHLEDAGQCGSWPEGYALFNS